jgi:hypothetical protein
VGSSSEDDRPLTPKGGLRRIEIQVVSIKRTPNP